jgi:glutathione S-transferase
MIASRAKRLEIQTQSIDLQNKPQWFLERCPTGKVPALLNENTTLFESLAICEYWEEVGEQPLHPQDPWLKALNRAWMEQNGGYFGDLFTILRARNQEAFYDAREQLMNKLISLNEAISGPYFNGEQFALIDAVEAPFLIMLAYLERSVPLSILGELTQLNQYTTKLVQHEAVQNALPSDLTQYWEQKLNQYEGYIAQFKS